MPDIMQDFFIKASPDKVFEDVSTPSGLDKWWTKNSIGEAAIGKEYKLGFGQSYEWKALVTKCIPDKEFEIVITKADKDWKG
ncbi:MAG: SRPBCC family protein, partial [Flammeovirgaceae bacterium]|nr:SRPBCC family protein [Flammeovirgaceae bacterium]